jgi:hypothetical protein
MPPVAQATAVKSQVLFQVQSVASLYCCYEALMIISSPLIAASINSGKLLDA